MKKDEAIKVLMAVACCSTVELHCYDCPMWDKNEANCNAWTNDDVVKAINTLNGDIAEIDEKSYWCNVKPDVRKDCRHLDEYSLRCSYGGFCFGKSDHPCIRHIKGEYCKQ